MNQASRTKMVKPAKVGEGPAENFGRSRPSVMRKGSEKGRVEDGKEKEGKRDGFGGKGEDEDEDGDGEDAEWEFVGEFVGE